MSGAQILNFTFYKIDNVFLPVQEMFAHIKIVNIQFTRNGNHDFLHICFSQNLIIYFGTSIIYPKTTWQQIFIEV